MAKFSKKYQVESTLKGLAHLLTGTGVDVSMSGNQIGVSYDKEGKAKNIKLPVINANIKRDHEDRLHGYLDMKVSEIKYSNKKTFQQNLEGVETDKRNKFKNFYQVAEELRTSKVMGDNYAGSKSNIEFGVKQALGDPYKTASVLRSGTEAEKNAIISKNLASWVYEKAGYTNAEFYNKVSGLSEYNDSLEEKFPEITDYINSLSDDPYSAVEMAKYMLEQVEKEPPQQDGDGEGDDESDSDNDGDGKSKLKSKLKSKSKSKSKGEKTDSDSESDDSDGESDDSDGESDDGDGDGNDSDGDGNENDSDKDSSSKNEGASKNKSPNKPPSKPKEIKLEPSKVTSISDMLEESIKVNSQKDNRPDDYVVFTRDLDFIGKPTIQNEKRIDIESVHNDVEKISYVMRKALYAAIEARSQQVKENGLKSGKITASNLFRLKFNNHHVFHRKAETNTKDVAVQLLVDCSGSMGGSKIRTAVRAAWAFALVLDSLQIKYEITGFTDGNQLAWQAKRRNEDAYNNIAISEFCKAIGKDAYNVRTEAVNFLVFKSFNEQFNIKNRKILAGISQDALDINLHANVDGECVEIAYNRLISQKEARKIMIVFSDGQPSGGGVSSNALHKHLKDTCKAIEASGVDLLGVGIEDSSVKSYYKKSIVINDVEQLINENLRQLKNMLTK